MPLTPSHDRPSLPDDNPAQLTPPSARRRFGLKPLRHSYFFTSALARGLYLFGGVAVIIVALWVALVHDAHQRREYAVDRAHARLTSYAGMVARQFETSILAMDIALSFLRRTWLADDVRFRREFAAILAPLIRYSAAQVCVVSDGGRVLFQGSTQPDGLGVPCSDVAGLWRSPCDTLLTTGNTVISKIGWYLMKKPMSTTG